MPPGSRVVARRQVAKCTAHCHQRAVSQSRFALLTRPPAAGSGLPLPVVARARSVKPCCPGPGSALISRRAAKGLPVTESMSPQALEPSVQRRPIEDLLASLSDLIRTVTVSPYGVDDVLANLCQLADQAIGLDGARVVRSTGGAHGGRRAPTSGVAALRRAGPSGSVSPKAQGPWVTTALQSRGRVLGFLELPNSSEQSWTDREQALVSVFAELATSCLALAEERGRAADRTEALEYRATHDELTGLPNRGLLMDRLEHALLADARRGGVVAVMFVDIDSLKDLNDALGHHFGDTVLRAVAQRLAGAVRAGDTVGRLGGDEFLVVCEHLTGTPAAVERRLRALGHRLLRRLAIPRPDQIEVVVSVSIGVAIGGGPPHAQELIGTADRAMYRAKALGGGQLVIAESPVLARIGPGTRQPPGLLRRRSPSRGTWTEGSARVPVAKPGS